MAYTLAGNNSAFTGGITLSGGANLIADNANALTSANSVTFTPGAGTVSGLYLYGTSVTIGALSGTAAGSMYIRNGSLVTDPNSSPYAGIVRSNAVLTVQQNTNTTFNGIISDGLNDNGAGDAKGWLRREGCDTILRERGERQQDGTDKAARDGIIFRHG